MKGGLQGLMKQAQQMQKKMEKMQEELKSLTVETSSGGGMVTAVVSGEKKLLELRIDKEVIDPDDPEMLQDLIVAAVNQGMQRADEKYKEEMGKIMPAGMMGGLPNLF